MKTNLNIRAKEHQCFTYSIADPIAIFQITAEVVTKMLLVYSTTLKYLDKDLKQSETLILAKKWSSFLIYPNQLTAHPELTVAIEKPLQFYQPLI